MIKYYHVSSGPMDDEVTNSPYTKLLKNIFITLALFSLLNTNLELKHS